MHVSSRQEGLEEGRAISAYSIEGSRALEITDTLLTLTPIAAMIERLYPYPGPYLGLQSSLESCHNSHLSYSRNHSSSKHSHSEKVDHSQTPTTNTTITATAVANTNANMRSPISLSGNKPTLLPSSTSAKSDTANTTTTMTRGNQPRLRAYSHSSLTPTTRRLVYNATYIDILMHPYRLFSSTSTLPHPLYLSFLLSLSRSNTHSNGTIISMTLLDHVRDLRAVLGSRSSVNDALVSVILKHCPTATTTANTSASATTATMNANTSINSNNNSNNSTTATKSTPFPPSSTPATAITTTTANGGGNSDVGRCNGSGNGSGSGSGNGSGAGGGVSAYQKFLSTHPTPTPSPSYQTSGAHTTPWGENHSGSGPGADEGGEGIARTRCVFLYSCLHIILYILSHPLPLLCSFFLSS